MDDLRLYEALLQSTREGLPTALATVVETSGSAPRKAGAKMLVHADGSILGTVGGGRVEAETIDAAREILATGRPRMLSFTLTEAHGFVCGGSLLVYVEPVLCAPRLLVFGAGHVGQALAAAAGLAGFRVTVTDARPEYASRERVPQAEETIVGDPAFALSKVPVDAGTFIVVATTDHRSDFEAVRAALATPAAYVGVVGSARKREALLRTLAEEGFPASDTHRIVMPVGLPIGAETPAEIAASIVAQLIEARRENDGAGRTGDPARRGSFAADGALQAAPAAG
ncbi:MAG TPA: XdhC/CoxI family protein [Candidatus Deferrimicrobiaceae bacterium]|jgi:xanthine dehydrogenase accessory factor